MRYLLNYIDNIIEKSNGNFYFYTLLILNISHFLHVSHVLGFFEIIKFDEAMTNYLNISIQTYICFVLLIRFNPWRKTRMTEGDRRVIFGTAVFLLGNLALTQYFLNYVKQNYIL
uniref:Uncharacterized protein n=1 Tax=viral metagenome TaxID=1070528 RepID=A0A6C0B8H4_9ZZZZ